MGLLGSDPKFALPKLGQAKTRACQIWLPKLWQKFWYSTWLGVKLGQPKFWTLIGLMSKYICQGA